MTRDRETTDTPQPVVSSYTEWEPLEEVIVGRVDGAAVPTWHVSLEATMPEAAWDLFKTHGGKPFPPEIVDKARGELEDLVHIFESEGVIVRRPDPVDHTRPFATPDWHSASGLYAAMPRDVLLVVGEEIIEVPMAWRSRYFEANAYRSLIKEYFKKGARWTAAPKPELREETYHYDYEEPADGEEMRYVITEFEPTFDAADFVRCGRDIIGQKSHVTNEFGIQWLQQHLGDDYRIHILEIDDRHPMHIDATLMPLAPGKLLANPERLKEVPEVFRHWEVLYAPPPCGPEELRFRMCSNWISMNVISLDEERVIVESHEEPLIKKLEEWGFKPIRCSLRNFNAFGGGFHCATADVRRRGKLESYIR